MLMFIASENGVKLSGSNVIDQLSTVKYRYHVRYCFNNAKVQIIVAGKRTNNRYLLSTLSMVSNYLFSANS